MLDKQYVESTSRNKMLRLFGYSVEEDLDFCFMARELPIKYIFLIF